MAEHWPPLAHGFEAQGSACWHSLPDHPGGQRHLYVWRLSSSQVPPLRHGELIQTLLMGVRQRRSVKPSLQVQLKSTVFNLVTARQMPPFMHGKVVHGSRNWHLLPTYPSRHLHSPLPSGVASHLPWFKHDSVSMEHLRPRVSAISDNKKVSFTKKICIPSGLKWLYKSTWVFS